MLPGLSRGGQSQNQLVAGKGDQNQDQLALGNNAINDGLYINTIKGCGVNTHDDG
jgi:hypothetical protein